MSPPHVFLVPAIVYPPLPAANSESIVPGAERLIGNMRLAQSPPLTLQIPLQVAHTHFYFYQLYFSLLFRTKNHHPTEEDAYIVL